MNGAPQFCHRCGANFTADQVVVIDGWRIDPRGTATHDGTAFAMTPMELILVHSLAVDAPRYVKTHVLLERMGSQTEELGRVATTIARLRRRCRDLDIPLPIAGQQNFGYCWQHAPPQQPVLRPAGTYWRALSEDD